jgi:hypothetical protein
VWREFYWVVAIVLFVLVLALGYLGFQDVKARDGFSLDSLYESFQLFWLQSGDVNDMGRVSVPIALEIARFGAPVLLGWAAVQAVGTLIRQRVLLLGVRLVYGNHIVIAGLGTIGFTLAAAFYEKGFRVVVIELDPANRNLAGCKERAIPTVMGSASDLSALQRASAARARTLVTACGDDATSLDVAAAVASISRRRLPTVFAHISDSDVWAILRADALAVDNNVPLRLEFFNIADLGSRALLREHPPFERPDYSRMDSSGALVVGLDGLAESLILHMARWWSNVLNSGGEKLHVTVVDASASDWCAKLTSKHPHLSTFCELAPLDDDVTNLDPESLPEAQKVQTAYLCAQDELANLAAGLDLRRRLAHAKIVLVVNDEGGGVGSLLRAPWSRIAHLEVFGVFSRGLMPDLILHGAVELIARAMHEQYLATNRDLVDSRGNTSLVHWENLPESLKESNRRFAAGIDEKLEASGCVLVSDPLAGAGRIDFAFTAAEVEELARLEHRRWVADLRRDGWKKTSGDKDPQRRLHPLLVTWEELSEKDREKDRHAVRGIPLMLSRAGLAIRRRGPQGIEFGGPSG